MSFTDLIRRYERPTTEARLQGATVKAGKNWRYRRPSSSWGVRAKSQRFETLVAKRELELWSDPCEALCSPECLQADD